MTKKRKVGAVGMLSAITLFACGPNQASHARAIAGASARAGAGNVECGPSGGSSASALGPAELGEAEVSGPYEFRSVSILGGGFVTGIEFSPLERDLILARTDVGGAYRWNADHWVPLTDWLDRSSSNSMGIESIAFDPSDAKVMYLAAGTYVTAGNGVILRSRDGGRSFERFALPTPLGANLDGRSMGERLAVDPSKPEQLYFASRTGGLWKSRDFGESFQAVSSFSATGLANIGLTFVLLADSVIYVGVSDPVGPSLYRSSDAGTSWSPVLGTPGGLFPHHAKLSSDGSLYLVFADAAGPNNVTRGAVMKYAPKTDVWTDISPADAEKRRFGGISLAARHAGNLVVTTLDDWSPDEIYRTTDDGAHWMALGASAVRDARGAEYLRFGKPGAALSATGWMGDVEIDPFDSSRALYITGQGVWWTDDLDACGATHWAFSNQGLEETVPLDLAVPPRGAELLSGLGDIGGFRHDDLTQPPSAGMYTNPVFGNTSSLDFAELLPEFVVRVGSGSSGTGAYSLDGGSSWTAFAAMPASSRGQGTVAVAADGSVIVWAPQGAQPSFSSDRGAHWSACVGLTTGAKVSADRADSSRFYAVSANGSELFVSRDAGASFTSVKKGLPKGTPRARAVFGIAGDVWLASGDGLYHSTQSGEALAAIDGVQLAYSVSFGKPAIDGAYPAVFVAGVVKGVDGVFRSDDVGQSFARIDDDRHRYGYLNLIAGDPKRFGRVYLGTSGRGIVYGDPRP